MQRKFLLIVSRESALGFAFSNETMNHDAISVTAPARRGMEARAKASEAFICAFDIGGNFSRRAYLE